MYNIGKKIKELRQKNDMTQEKLADYLFVSYQAVSKWETGVSNPDISLIGPLSKLFNVSADELLGLGEKAADIRYDELKKLYDETYKTGDLEKRLETTALAVKEYPGDMKWLNDYGWALWCTALSCDEAFKDNTEEAIRVFKIVIENCSNEIIKCNAIHGIVQCMRALGRKEEGRAYAELYPNVQLSKYEKDYLISMCLSGEEAIRQRQLLLEGEFNELVGLLLTFHSEDANKAAENIIKAIITDNNYGIYNYHLCDIQFRKAEGFLKKGDFDFAINELSAAFEYAREYYKIETGAEYEYSSALFNHLKFNALNWARTGTSTKIDDYIEGLNDKGERYPELKKYVGYNELLEKAKSIINK